MRIEYFMQKKIPCKTNEFMHLLAEGSVL
jgi:hypothetical protein